MTKMGVLAKNEFLLERDTEIKIPIEYLPASDFIYSITAINPFLEEIELNFRVRANDTVQFKKIICFSSVTVTESFQFSLSADSREIEVIFLLRSGSKVWLHFPVSPRLLQKIETTPTTIKETVIKIVSEIETEEDDEDYTDQKDSYQPIGAAVPEPTNVDSFHLTHFKGVLNLQQAEKQLDYVIYNKVFGTEGASGFQKWKKSVYRRMVIFLYKKLSKDHSRKVYFAKLYRNYVNNNIIADNLQAS
ncbi:MAG TPA: hypothetical protein VFP87_07385 [Chitinophagaceae bacterium]|nr:hypothetical protein [Chitinophagaceae bacterium]